MKESHNLLSNSEFPSNRPTEPVAQKTEPATGLRPVGPAASGSEPDHSNPCRLVGVEAAAAGAGCSWLKLLHLPRKASGVASSGGGYPTRTKEIP